MAYIRLSRLALLERVRDLMQAVLALHRAGSPPYELFREATAVADEIEAASADVEREIEDCMARQLRKHNVPPVVFDAHGLSGIWHNRQRRGA